MAVWNSSDPATLQRPGERDAGAGAAIRARLRGLVTEILAAKSAARPFSDDDTLAEIGIASVDMVTLLLSVEREFDLEVPTQEISADVFRSIATIESLVLRLLPHAAPA
jgi:acyl carrier protein